MNKDVIAKLAGAAVGGFLTAFLTALFSGTPPKVAASAGAAAAASTGFAYLRESPGSIFGQR